MTTEVHPDEAAFLRYLGHLLQLRAAGRRWPHAVSEATLKLPHTSWEPIPRRWYRGKLQFLYSRRAPDDPDYPPDPVKGPPWCFAGTNNRGEPLATGLERIGQEHFPDGSLVVEQFAGCINWHRESRGPDIGVVFFCRYVGKVPPGAEWRDWDDPPEHMTAAHRILAHQIIAKIRARDNRPWFLDDPR